MNGQIFIQDTTKNGEMVYLNNIKDTVYYLESICAKLTGQPRKQYMYSLTELGYGYDLNDNNAFIRALQERVNMGMVKNGRYVKCDITMEHFNKPEYGN